MPKILDSASKKLAANEKHYYEIELNGEDKTESTVYENSFGNLSFVRFCGNGINRISGKAWGKSAQALDIFYCLYCELNDSPSNYNIWTALSQLTNLSTAIIGLNVSEIPSNAIKPINGQESKLNSLIMKSVKSLTIKSNALSNLK